MFRWRNGLALGAVLLLGTACNPVSFALPPPDFRGITIPLPPPSLVDAPTQVIDLEGTIGHDPGPGTMVFMWSSEEVEGAIVDADQNGDFALSDHVVTVDDTCLELFYQTLEAGDLVESTHGFYAVILGSGDTCTDEAMPCSQTDEEDNCVCLDYRASGC